MKIINIITFLFVLISISKSNYFVQSYEDAKTITLSILSIYMLIYIILKIKNYKQAVILNLFDLISSIFLFYILVSNYYTIEANQIAYPISVFIFYFFLKLFAHQKTIEEFIQITYKMVAIVILVQLILITYQAYNFGIYTENPINYKKPQIYGSLGNINLVSLFFASNLPVLMYLYRTNNKLIKVILGFIIFLSIILIFFSQCRATWVSIFISSIIFCIALLMSPL